jgi:hypothetical protein
MKRQLKINYDGKHYSVYELLSRPLAWNPSTMSWECCALFDTYDDAKAAVEEMLKFPQYFEGESK